MSVEKACNHMIGLQEDDYGHIIVWYANQVKALEAGALFLTEQDDKFKFCSLCGEKLCE